MFVPIQKTCTNPIRETSASISCGPSLELLYPPSHTSALNQINERMNRRQKEWQTEVDELRKNFFSQTSPVFSAGTSRPLSSLSSVSSAFISPPMSPSKCSSPAGDEFYVDFDLSGFSPEEIMVEVSGGKLLVSAQHKEQGINRSITRSFERRVDIPSSVDPSTITFRISPSSHLIVSNFQPTRAYHLQQSDPIKINANHQTYDHDSSLKKVFKSVNDSGTNGHQFSHHRDSHLYNAANELGTGTALSHHKIAVDLYTKPTAGQQTDHPKTVFTNSNLLQAFPGSWQSAFRPKKGRNETRASASYDLRADRSDVGLPLSGDWRNDSPDSQFVSIITSDVDPPSEPAIGRQFLASTNEGAVEYSNGIEKVLKGEQTISEVIPSVQRDLREPSISNAVTSPNIKNGLNAENGFSLKSDDSSREDSAATFSVKSDSAICKESVRGQNTDSIAPDKLGEGSTVNKAVYNDISDSKNSKNRNHYKTNSDLSVYNDIGNNRKNLNRTNNATINHYKSNNDLSVVDDSKNTWNGQPVAYAAADHPTSKRRNRFALSLNVGPDVRPEQLEIDASESHLIIRIIDRTLRPASDNSEGGETSGGTMGGTSGTAGSKAVEHMFHLPTDINPELLVAQFSEDGFLTLEYVDNCNESERT